MNAGGAGARLASPHAGLLSDQCYVYTVLIQKIYFFVYLYCIVLYCTAFDSL